MFLFFKAEAQQRPNIEEFKANIQGNNLWITWKCANVSEANYWEMQGSADGKSFQAIGLVLGGRPGNETEFIFKCNNSNINKDYKMFRVLQIQKDQTAVVYNAVLVK